MTDNAVTDDKVHVVEEAQRVRAPMETVYGLVADVIGWTQHFHPAVHAEYVSRCENEDVVRQWSLAGEDGVRVWTVRRRLDPAGRITFVHEPPAPPATDVRGEWLFTTDGPDVTEVRMRHEFQVAGGAPVAGPIAENIRANTLRYLAALADTAQRKAEVDELTVSFEDSLVIDGPIEAVYAYLYAADRWPERIPHVTRLDLRESTPNVQFFDMDTKAADGSIHTTRSVRICQPPNLIVYKQIRLPDQLDAHTGHWKFTQTAEGVIASARHTATIKRSALPLKSPGETPAGARRYVRKVLSANSMSNLRLAKRFAEEQAGG
ncbi:aromatase/cyclase [Nonomuraea sp. NPDC049158]|uniref:aromatase/cyclase n=1 Tax=Nonomuraea sp. NPDC049158 TaxID=3155649 RepID=UPI0033CB6B77